MCKSLRLAALVLKTMRPRQWSKNLFVVAPMVFAAKAGDLALVARAAAAFGCFCGLSGAAYLVNDVWDRRRDAVHPVKRRRPVASGALAPAAAGLAAVGVLGGCLAAAAALNTTFFLIAAAYVVLMLAYSAALKNVVLADVVTIAAGFVLRAVAGAAVVAVPNSQWLVICTALVSLFLALGKRRYELNRLDAAAARHRPVLRKYNVPLLDQLISMTTAACLVCYLLYCVLSETAAERQGLLLTAPFVAYGLFRYLYCIYRKAKGGSPEDILLKDKVFLANGVLYGLTVLLVLYLPVRPPEGVGPLSGFNHLLPDRVPHLHGDQRAARASASRIRYRPRQDHVSDDQVKVSALVP
ncbi:MAG TPA: decaprenyl-phosphate phosphoribosyltransferase [Gemmataceae bacterium]|nr:decaprenyl-phosphate phosphoribosyltransferase [Gemmataceae bacterium]